MEAERRHYGSKQTEDAADSTRYDAFCPFVVEPVAMMQRWDRITFLHWKYEVATVQRLLPDGLTVEVYDGHAWVGLVPFFMNVQVRFFPRIPWLFDFPETNVRTYVRGPSGESGVWFFSLEAARLNAVLAARSTYRLPYYWAKMTVEEHDNVIRYSSRRRWPGRPGTRSMVGLRIGETHSPENLEEFDHYLTARWILYGTWGKHLLMARAQHPPWSLHSAHLESLHDELVEATGLPAPTGSPIVHWSPGVDVRIGYPERADAQ